MGTDGLPLRRVDHVRFFVGNARQSAYFYRNAFGFDVIAYAGLETKTRHEAGYVLRQGEITFVLTSSLRANDPDNMRLIFHGDGVKDVALAVDDVKAAFEYAVRNHLNRVAPRRSHVNFRILGGRKSGCGRAHFVFSRRESGE